MFFQFILVLYIISNVSQYHILGNNSVNVITLISIMANVINLSDFLSFLLRFPKPNIKSASNIILTKLIKKGE